MQRGAVCLAAVWLAACGTKDRPPASAEELARTGRLAEAARAVAASSLDERPALAEAVAAACAADRLDDLARAAGAEPDLLTAVADRVERERGSAAVLELRERAVAAAGDRAEAWDALGRARVASGRVDDALAAWDRAAAAAPAQPSYRLAPIRALVAVGDRPRARDRAGQVASAARAARDPDALVTASAALAEAGNAGEAAVLAREASAARPGDGRLAFLLGDRLAGAGDPAAAAAVWTELLVCGAHGRSWHRHEVAGRLLRLTQAGGGAAVNSALAASGTCSAVEEADLASYLAELKKHLDGGAALER